jgi:hypothetical protein
VQAVRPALAVYIPATQLAQAVDPALAVYDPAAQDRHWEAPVVDTY